MSSKKLFYLVLAVMLLPLSLRDSGPAGDESPADRVSSFGRFH
jgi:hypothetical protein